MDINKGWAVVDKNRKPVGLTVKGWDFFPHFFFADEEDATKFLKYLKKMPFYPEGKDLKVHKVTII
jgi:hypothetical protein